MSLRVISRVQELWSPSYCSLLALWCFFLFGSYLPVQITYGILFSLVIAFTSDALSTVPEKVSVLARDASFRQEFQDIVRTAG